MVTFKEFKDSRRVVDEVSTEVPDDFDEQMGSGSIYLDNFFILDVPNKSPPRYNLFIAGSAWTSSDLDELERILWAYAVKEGF